MREFTVEQFDVPSAEMLKVSSLICDHELDHHIMDVNESKGTFTLELQYLRQDREVIHQIEDIIADHREDDDQEEESEEDKNEE